MFLGLAQREGKGGDFISTLLFFLTPAFTAHRSWGQRSTYVLWGMKDGDTQQAQQTQWTLPFPSSLWWQRAGLHLPAVLAGPQGSASGMLKISPAVPKHRVLPDLTKKQEEIELPHPTSFILKHKLKCKYVLNSKIFPFHLQLFL